MATTSSWRREQTGKCASRPVRDRYSGVPAAALSIESFGPIKFFDERNAVEKFSIRPVEHVVEAIPVGLQQQFPGPPSEVSVHQDRRLVRIPIMRVMRHELEIPLHLSRIGIEREDAIGIQIVPGPVAAVESGRGLPVGRRAIQLGVVGPGGPSRSASLIKGKLPHVSEPASPFRGTAHTRQASLPSTAAARRRSKNGPTRQRRR